MSIGPQPRPIVIGIGNTERGDDGAGRLAASLLRDALAGAVEVVELDGEATAVLARLEGRSLAYLIDACVSGAEPGSFRRFAAHEAPLPQLGSDLSTHGFGLAAAVELARTLGLLPARTFVYAIEGARFDVGSGPSAAVAEAARQVAAEIRAELKQILA
jgi:hydrogenase maturation protease